MKTAEVEKHGPLSVTAKAEKMTAKTTCCRIGIGFQLPIPSQTSFPLPGTVPGSSSDKTYKEPHLDWPKDQSFRKDAVQNSPDENFEYRKICNPKLRISSSRST